jgi:beta-galactosidase
MLRFNYSFLLLFFVLFSKAQNLVVGGLGNAKANLVLLSNSKINKENELKAPNHIPYLHFNDTSSKINFSPLLPNNQNWVALFNVNTKGKKLNFFMYDGWMASTERITTNHRLRRFEEDITNKISSNAYHMAFQRKQAVENEVFMLVVSPKDGEVKIELSKAQFGVQRTLTYNMKAWEAKFVHIVMPPQEYTVITWSAEQTDRTNTAIKNWKFLHTNDDKNQSQIVAATKTKSSNWQSITIPHTWNTTDVFDSRNFKDTINIMELFKRGIGWYTTSLNIALAEKNKNNQLHFLGANQITEVWVNGSFVGKHIGGYTGFTFNLNKHLRVGNNTVLVKVDSRYNFDVPPHTADYNFLGGLYREVLWQTTNNNYITNTKITTPKVSHKNAAIQIQSTFSNTGAAKKIITNLINPYNEIMQSWVQPILPNQTNISIFDTIKNPILWSTKNPTLYKVYSTLYDANDKALDQTIETMGFRFFNFTADNGFSLNGETLKLKGVNVHQDYLNKGWAIDSAQKLQDYLLMKKMGVNYVRMSHYPKHPYELHLCDSLGFVVWEEIPVVNTVGTEAFIANATMMMQEVIERDYNRPSVIFWGVGNEYYRNFFSEQVANYAIQCTKEVAAICKKLDPYRYTIQAQNDLVDNRILELTDVQGRNRYFGWYEKTYNDFEHEMEEEHKKNPTWKLLVSEYGAEGKYGYHVNNPKIFDHSETYQVNFHKAYWKVIEAKPYIAGGTIWNMFDFASFAKIGNSPHINKKGMMSFDRKPKDVFYYYQSVWTDDLMVHIAGHTNTHRKTIQGNTTPIEVFSNATDVELFVNGISQGKKQKGGNDWIWNVDLKEGYHNIKAIATLHGEVKTSETSFYLRVVKSLDNKEDLKDLDGDGF